MKKFVLILLSLLYSMVLFANGQNEEVRNDVTDTKLVLAIWGGDNDVASMESMLDAVASELAGIEVEVLLLADYDKTLTTRIIGGQQIDIMMVAESVHQFSSRNQMASLNDLISEFGLDMDKTFGVNKNLYTRDGNTFALPFRGGPMMVYCNMDLLENKPEVNWTFDQFVEAASGAYTPNEDTSQTKWGFVPVGNETWWPWYTSFIYSAGGSILDVSGKPNFDDPKTIKGLKNYTSFILGNKVGPSIMDMSDIGQTSPDPVFNSGNAGMITTGWWNVGSLQGADFNWDIAPIPNGEGRGTVIFGQGIGITSISKNKEASFKVLQALTGIKAQEAMIDVKWDIPSNVQVLNSDAFLNAEWSEVDLDMQSVADAISKGAISLPYHPKWNQIHDVIGNVINLMFMGEIDIESGAIRIQEELLTQVFTD